MKKTLFGGFLIFLVLCAAFSGFLWNKYFLQMNTGSHEEILIEVNQGESFHQVAKELEKKGVIRSANLFSLFAKLTGEAGKTKVGEYALRGDMSPSEVLNVINSGKSVGRTFTIPEGTNIYEIAEMWEDEGFGTQKEFMDAVKDHSLIKNLLGEDHITLEGYLFPETYQVTKFTDAKQLVTTMVRKFLNVWKDIEEKSKNSGMTRHQIITLASIIEKETGAPEERPMISSVFHNRLKKGMLLQTDPTVIYGKADLTGKVVISITRADLTTPTRYNTYVIKGLPPGPIAAPSLEAIISAIHPAESDYLYFVSRNQGTHTFSKDYQSHLDAVKRFQMDPKAREGKSWRDLKKKKAEAAPPKA